MNHVPHRRSIVHARCRLAWVRLSSWWPDLFAGLLVALGFGSLLLGSDDLDSVSLSRAVSTDATYAWLAVLTIAGIGLAYAMVVARYTLAAVASSVIAALLATNALAAILSRGPGVISAVVTYSLAAIYMSERAKQLDAKLPNAPESYR